MKAMCNFVKIYRGQEMPHFLYTLDRDKWLKTASNGTVIMLELEAKKIFTIITAGGRRRENAGSLSEERRSVCFI